MMDKKILWGVLLGSMLSVTSCIGKQAGEVLSVRMPVEFQTEKEKNVSDNREADIAADWQEPYPKYSGEAAMIVNHNQPLRRRKLLPGLLKITASWMIWDAVAWPLPTSVRRLCRKGREEISEISALPAGIR